MRRHHGITRTVFVVGRWAIKVPSLRHRYLLRGWLANRSEWKQRRRPDVARPIITLGHLVTVFPRAQEIGAWEPEDCPERALWPSGLDVDEWDPHQPCGHSTEEAKGSSWGRFGDRWLLIDYDRAWQDPRGAVGAAYYGRQERRARKWSTL